MSNKEAGVSLGQGTAIAESEKALKVILEDLHQHCWIPKSQIHDDSEVYDMKNSDGEVVVTAWFAKEKQWA